MYSKLLEGRKDTASRRKVIKMTINREGDLICDCCGRIIIESKDTNKKTNTKKANECVNICGTCTSAQQTIMPETD